jgi:hypothetical protein
MRREVDVWSAFGCYILKLLKQGLKFGLDICGVPNNPSAFSPFVGFSSTEEEFQMSTEYGERA